MKRPIVLDKSLLFDPSLSDHLVELNCRFQPVIPSSTVFECVSQKSALSPRPAALERLEGLVKLLPDATVCPMPAMYIQAELRGETPALLDFCDRSVLADLFLPDFSWEPRIDAWKVAVTEVVQLFEDMTRHVPLALEGVEHKGDVTEDTFRLLEGGNPALASKIYETIWRPRLGDDAPAAPGRMMAARVLSLFCGALRWFGKHDSTPENANRDKVFNEVVDLDIRCLAIACGGFGCLDGGGRSTFRLLTDLGVLFPYSA